MAENLELSYGLVYSQRVLLKLTEAGLARQVAYEIVQRHAMRAWRERRPFVELLAADPAVTDRVPPDELKACFDPTWFIRNVDAIFKRLGLDVGPPRVTEPPGVPDAPRPKIER